MINERRIGSVISVDSFRLYIKLDDNLKSLYKSGYEDIYEVAKINSYIIIPIGSERIVAMVTRVRSMDETDFAKDKSAIFLTQAARYLVATMIGTINSKGKYIQGVYNYPVLDNPVWYVTKDNLNSIFDHKNENDQIDFANDFYLPIGSSPSFPDYKIKINPDKFFGKHAAILGNTGSGKSCTVASILQSLFKFNYNSQNLQSAHIIIFDTNGEYKAAFGKDYEQLKEVNPFYINKEGLKVPYWFMNYDDCNHLFKPTPGTQEPILKRAITLAKSNKKATKDKVIPQAFLSRLETIKSNCDANDFKIKNFIYYELSNLIVELENLDITFDLSRIISELKKLVSIKDSLVENRGYINGVVNTQDLVSCSDLIDNQLNKYFQSLENNKSNASINVDLPIHYDFKEMILDHFNQAIEEQELSGNRIREFVSTLKLRLVSYMQDDRIADPLLLNSRDDIDNSLARFIAFILGDTCKVCDDFDDDLYSDYHQNKKNIDTEKPSQLTIIDMSLIPSEVLETITGLIGRIILEFVSKFEPKDRGKTPTVLVLEEAQNYIPEKNKDDKDSITKKVFERIAREGRKFGISLLVSSQRPTELSKTILSQCNSFIIHRLQNPEDQKYVRQLVSAANEDILDQLPILPQQHVVVMGDAVRTPVQAKMNAAYPLPNSHDPRFIENWLVPSSNAFPDYFGIADAWSEGKKYIEKAKDTTIEEPVKELVEG